MRKTVFTLTLGSLLIALTTLVYTADARKPEQEETSIDLKEELRKAAEREARETLKMKEWEIYLTPQEAPKRVKNETNVLTFSDGKVASKNLSDKGYNTSNFSLTIQDDGLAVWETMQADVDRNLAFWRGELRENVMRGTLFLSPQKGDKITYSFTTVKPEIKEGVSAEQSKKKKDKR